MTTAAPATTSEIPPPAARRATTPARRLPQRGAISSPEPRLYRIPDAIRLLSISRSVIYEQIRAGRLRTVHQGRACLISDTAIRDYIALLETEAQAGRQVA